MALPNIFQVATTELLTERMSKLTPTSQPHWGVMNVAQMLAHCSTLYEMIYESKHPKANIFLGFILKTFVKKNVVNETPIARNGKSAPTMIITDSRDFEKEKVRLNDYIIKTQSLGEVYFDNKASLYFGKLSKTEWSNMLYKHLDYHLTQFGV
jgi:hypothetical protein